MSDNHSNAKVSKAANNRKSRQEGKPGADNRRASASERAGRSVEEDGWRAVTNLDPAFYLKDRNKKRREEA